MCLNVRKEKGDKRNFKTAKPEVLRPRGRVHKFACKSRNCGQLFDSAQDRDEHMGEIHFRCTLGACVGNENFTTLTEYAFHVWQTHELCVFLSCEDGKKAGEWTRDDYIIHLQRKHHRCMQEYCIDQKHESRQAFIEHMGEKHFKCGLSECLSGDLGSVYKPSFVTHNYEKHYPCRVGECRAGPFTTYEDLKAHTQTEHPYLCTACPYVQFSSFKELLSHIDQHEAGKVKLKQFPYEGPGHCLFCHEDLPTGLGDHEANCENSPIRRLHGGRIFCRYGRRSSATPREHSKYSR